MGVTIATARNVAQVAGGNQNLTTGDLGGQTPKAVLHFVTRAVSDGVSANHMVVGLGAATGASNRWATTSQAQDGVNPTSCDRRSMSDECIALLSVGGSSVDGEADHSAWMADGQTINWGNAPGNGYFIHSQFFAGDDVTAEADVFTPDIQNNTVNITLGWQPDVVFFATAGQSFGDGGAATARLSHGMAVRKTPVEQYGYAYIGGDGSGSGNPASQLSDNYAVGELGIGGGFNWAAEIAFLANGFSCTSRLGNPGTDQIGYLAISFGGAVRFEASIIDTPVAPGDDPISYPGWTPQWVYLLPTQMPAINTAYTDANAGSFGVGAFTTTAEYSASVQNEDVANPSDTKSISDDICLILPQDDGTAGHAASYVSMDTLGWTYNYSATLGTAKKVISLAVEEYTEVTPPTDTSWISLVEAAQRPEAEPIARVTVNPNVLVGDKPLSWSLLGDFAGDGPLDGVTTDNDVLVLIQADGDHRIITDGQDTTQWSSAWTAMASPSGTWGTNSEVIAIATDGDNIQVFARKITAPFDLYVNESADDGTTWGGWTNIGTSTYTNGVTNYVIGAALYDTLFLRHCESSGISIEVFNDEGAVPWARYDLDTRLTPELPPSIGGFDVVAVGEIAVLYVVAKHRSVDVDGYRIHVGTFYSGDWGPFEYLASADTLDIVDSVVSSFAFQYGATYGLTYDLRDAIAPPILSRDDFVGYGDYWVQVSNAREPGTEIWTLGLTFGADLVRYVEGTRGMKTTLNLGASDEAYMLLTDLDLGEEGRFENTDYVYIAAYIVNSAGVNYIDLGFWENRNVDGYEYRWNAGLSDGWNFKSIIKTNFAVVGAPAGWGAVDNIQIQADANAGENIEVTIDDWRIVKADPNDSAVGNDTSTVWDFLSGQWHIYSDEYGDTDRVTLGQLNSSSTERLAVRHAWPQRDDYQITVPIKAMRENGYLGIAFRITDTTVGSEDCYALVADTAANTLRLYEFTNGAAAQLDSTSFTFNLDTWYYLGVRMIGDRITGFCSANEDDIYNTIQVDATDATKISGQVGLITWGLVARFEYFRLSVYPITELRKAWAVGSHANLWPAPLLYEITGFTYPRQRVVWQGDYFYSFDESDADYIVVEAPISGSGVELPCEDCTIYLPLVSSATTAATGDVTLSNRHGEYNDILAPGDEITIEGGYRTYAGELYVTLLTGVINVISGDVHTNAMKLRALDYVYKLKKWASNKLYIFKSQFKLWLDMINEDDTKHLVDIINGFEYDSVDEWYRTKVAAEENLILHGEYFNDVVVISKAFFVDDHTDAWLGIILRSDSEGENCYGVLWNYDADTIRIRKKTDGVWGASLASAALTAYYNASLWVRVEIVNNVIYVWTSDDAVEWTYRVSYADSSPLEDGHVGFAAYPAADQSVDLREFEIHAFDTEKTVERLIRQVASMAGILEFQFEDEINDTFTGTNGDAPSSANWDTGGDTFGTVDIQSNRLRCIAGAGSWGYMNSVVSRKTFVLDFDANVVASGRAGIIFRTNSTFTEGYRLEIRPGAVGTGHILLYDLSTGDRIINLYPRVAIPTATMLSYILSVQDSYNEDTTFISLWLGERLIFSHHDNKVPAAGYVGVASYNNVSNYFDNFIIDRLDTPVISRGENNYFVINVGETGEKLIGELAAIQGARWFFDGDGVLTAGILEPGTGVADVFDSDRTIIAMEDELTAGSWTRDDDPWVSHVRVVAKDGIYGDAYDNTLLTTRGYRFHRINISASLTSAQCEEIAQDYIDQQQKKLDVVNSLEVSPAQLGLSRRMRFHAHVHRDPGDATTPLIIDTDYIVGSMRIGMKREPTPDWSMTIEPEEV